MVTTKCGTGFDPKAYLTVTLARVPPKSPTQP